MRSHTTDWTSVGVRRTVGGGPVMRLRARTRWIAVSTVIAMVLVAVPAFAGVPASEPSGCNTVATGGWYYSCWVSNNSADPDRISDFSTAIQTVLTYNWQSNDNPGSIDGYFGTNSYNGTRQFQTNHPPLVVDGIVGSATWNKLEQDLRYTGLRGGYFYHHVEKYEWAEYFRQRASTGVWDVKRYRNGSWNWVRIDRWRS